MRLNKKLSDKDYLQVASIEDDSSFGLEKQVNSFLSSHRDNGPLDVHYLYDSGRGVFVAFIEYYHDIEYDLKQERDRL